ncbi:long-chain fatty acid--CoA ligase [Sporosarcina sp. P13]|uniref:fatty acid--CoA ligase family protein n=1 Tax=Sporosarcina sp. P13 TaxID=2048263 RepID=UPI000C167DA4|nr:fatty acid--CoA ligase family protein [Sporosarcina sp. P13]PIC64485.1 long-chain fatty acid--CoA ligase [Sporosarcina sp. P13]
MNLVSSVHETAQTKPQKIAYRFMGKDTTYAAFDLSVSLFASALKDLGVNEGDKVAFLLGNTPHYLISLYATMRIGATAVPINPLYTPDEISFILENSDAKVVIAIDQLLPLVEVASQTFPMIENFIVCEMGPDAGEKLATLADHIKTKVHAFTTLMKQAKPLSEIVTVDENESAVILYTSGTTGYPKGAMLSHKNIYSNARDVGDYLGFSENDRIVATLPLFHVFALTVVANAPLLKGATILLEPRFSPGDIFTLIREQKATVFAGVPTMYNFLYQYPEGKTEDFETIRLSISGGSSLPVSLLHDFEEKFQVRVSEGYGLSEASPVTCFNPLDRERVPGSIGTNIMNVENKIVNEMGEEVPVNEVGELIVRGPNVMIGYYKQPEETAAAIRDGWLYTGDLARRDENGYFYIVDRKKDMIIVGGFNVYPREVEEVLFSHRDIVEAAVVGIPDTNFGEEVHAYVVLKEGSKATEQTVHDFCAKRLAKYKVPKHIEFLKELPKNATGKILRRSLKNQIRS